MTLTYRSDRARMARVLVPSALLFLTGNLAYILELLEGGLSLLYAISIVASISFATLAIWIMNDSVIVTLEDDRISFLNGFRLLGAKPRSIPLDRIHTIEVLMGQKKGVAKSAPGTITLTYRWPERRMVHATATISVASIPDGVGMILEIARRTGAKIKLHTGSMNNPEISLEELEKRSCQQSAVSKKVNS